MANTNKHFNEYNITIRLTDARRNELKKSRKELRNKVRSWFKDNKPNETKPKFSGQGSMAMDTIINPIPRKETNDKGEEITQLYYDVDDGIYFEGDKDIKDRPTPTTYHSWIVDAVKGHTNQDPIDKNTCVRTIFANGRNIDQPIYYKKGNTPELAHKRDGYIESDPKLFTDWFLDLVNKNVQLLRLVRYAKGWKDYREFSNKTKEFPSGMILTILFAENAVYRTDRDDIAMKETLMAIEAKLKLNFECNRPTTPKGENLLKDYTQKDYFMKCLADFISDAKGALEVANFKKSTEYWRNHFGDRFPLGEDKDDTSNSTGGLGGIIPTTTRPYAS